MLVLSNSSRRQKPVAAVSWITVPWSIRCNIGTVTKEYSKYQWRGGRKRRIFQERNSLHWTRPPTGCILTTLRQRLWMQWTCLTSTIFHPAQGLREDQTSQYFNQRTKRIGHDLGPVVIHCPVVQEIELFPLSWSINLIDRALLVLAHSTQPLNVATDEESIPFDQHEGLDRAKSFCKLGQGSSFERKDFRGVRTTQRFHIGSDPAIAFNVASGGQGTCSPCFFVGEYHANRLYLLMQGRRDSSLSLSVSLG
jgi:hypothetical protein